MTRWIAGLDRLTAASRPAWGWLGELCLVVLGVHLAADRLDDLLLDLLAPLQVPWPTPDFALQLSTWTAVAVELHVVCWAAWMLWRSRNHAALTGREWLDRLTIRSALAVLAWAPLALVGSWVVAMAVEDFTAPVLGEPALWLSWVVAGLVAWRLGWPGFARVLFQAPQPGRRIEGWMALPTVLTVTVLGGIYGLPLQGALDLLASLR